ncbi:MAG: hypothetical protein A2Y89_03010 [Chloroflexi bacterium RBG_13_51_18]|nr:MAG: hypothetical protein A2Y89_03010 [Chloroflexi bacterium RBG_13_51_18]
MENDYGVPTAPIVTSRFADYVQRDGRSHGMHLRWSFPPYPVGFVSKETLHGYVQGNDPISSAPLMEEVLFALTQPLTDAEKNPKIVKRPNRPRLLEPATEENLHRLFLENGWTDGLPIILPTEERVAEMLTGTDHDPQEVIGMMSVTTHEERLQYTVERVAVNAVMAGARPEHFPVILALGASGRPSLPSSTTSFASMMVVNGPIRNEIGMNSGLGALSPVNYANSVIGRAWTLMSINLGDMRPGATFTASTGTTINYNNMCFAENEENSAWEPFHVRKGFKRDESTVSLFRGWNVLTMGLGPATRMLEVMKSIGGPFGGAFTFICDPLVAKSLKNEGYADPMKLSEWLVNELNPRFKRPEMVNFIVAGGEMNPMWVTTDFSYFQSVSIDPWIPKAGIKKDAKPLRMPEPVLCKDGSCGISH